MYSWEMSVCICLNADAAQAKKERTRLNIR